jgi:Protein of unknown function (DUF4231)
MATVPVAREDYDSGLIDRLTEIAKEDPAGSFAIEELKRQIRRAEKQRANWQRWYYGGRTTVTVVAAAVTALAGASAGLSGNAGLAIKITAAVLSFVVAATNGVLEVWQVTNRWRLYRVLRNRLWRAGWRLATADASKQFQGLTKQIGTALGDFEHQYLMEVVLNGGGEERPNGQADRNKKPD